MSSGTCVGRPQSVSTRTEHCECQLCLSATNNPPGDWPSCLSRTNGRNSGRLFWKHVGLFAHLFECQLGQAHRGCWRFPVPTSLPCYPFSQGGPAAPEQRGGEAGGRLPRTMPHLGPLVLTAGPQRCPVNSDLVTFLAGTQSQGTPDGFRTPRCGCPVETSGVAQRQRPTWH